MPRKHMVRWQRIEASNDIIFTVAWERTWMNVLTRTPVRVARFRGIDANWKHYPSGELAPFGMQVWLCDLYDNIIRWSERRDARAAREAAALEKLKPRARHVTEITDAEIVAAANVMLEPQASVHEINGVRTYKTYDELDEIAQMELGYQVAVAIAAAEAARFASPGSSPASSRP